MLLETPCYKQTVTCWLITCDIENFNYFSWWYLVLELKKNLTLSTKRRKLRKIRKETITFCSVDREFSIFFVASAVMMLHLEDSVS